MSRTLALLPFEVSRRAPEPPLTDEELGWAEDELAFAEGEALAEELLAEGTGDETGAAEVSVGFEVGATGAQDFDEQLTEAVAADLASQDFEGSKNSEGSEASERSESEEEEVSVEDGLEDQDLGAGAAPEEIEDAEHAWLARADRVALARWVRAELARLLAESGALAPVLLELEEDAEAEAEELDDLELGLEAAPAAAAAELARCELGLSCKLRADAGAVEVLGLLGDAAGEERVRFAVASPLAEAWRLPVRLSRELLLALGEDAAATALPGDEAAPADPEAVLDLVRGARALAESGAARARIDARGVEAPRDDATSAEPEAEAPAGRDDDRALADPSPGLLQLLDALALAPGLTPARELILRSAAEAASGPAMPAHLAALERLVELNPGDSDALLGLAAYRRLHLDNEGARDLAVGGATEARVLAQLAALAESEGRLEEAVRHLREATRLVDEAGLYLRLGTLLRAREPLESSRAFQRAVVLAPEEPLPRLELARQLQALGETTRAATEAARAVQLARAWPALAHDATELLAQLIAAS